MWDDPWNLGQTLKELDSYALPGTAITFLNSLTDDGDGNGEWPALLLEAAKRVNLQPASPILQHLKHHVGCANDPDTLSAVCAHEYNTFVMLATSQEDDGCLVDPSLRDARVVSAFIAVSDYILRLPANPFTANMNFVCEMASEHNRELLQVLSTKCHRAYADFVDVVDLVAMLVAQICYRPVIDQVWTELLTSEGSEVHAVPSTLYTDEEDEELKFWQMQQRVKLNGNKNTTGQSDICIGYIALDELSGHMRCRLAPNLDSCHRYTALDKILIVALEHPCARLSSKV